MIRMNTGGEIELIQNFHSTYEKQQSVDEDLHLNAGKAENQDVEKLLQYLKNHLLIRAVSIVFSTALSLNDRVKFEIVTPQH